MRVLALVIALIRPRLGIAAFVWAGLACLSRVYSGLHFPSDIIGAAALGAVFEETSGVNPLASQFPRKLGLVCRCPVVK
jgi:hypothetical protein